MSGFSFAVGLAFTLNYIVGTGFLTLPWAFQEAGSGLGLLVLSIVTIFAVFACSQLLDALARAQVLLVTEIDEEGGGERQTKEIENRRSSGASESGNEGKRSSTTTTIHPQLALIVDKSRATVIATSVTSYQSLNDDDDDDAGAGIAAFDRFKSELPDLPSRLAIASFTDVKLEVTDLCEIFLGTLGRRVYMITLSLYMLGTLWAYSTLFATTLSGHVPLHGFSRNGFDVYLFIFGVIVVPPTLVELNEQVYMQVSLSVGRVVMFLTMLLTILQANLNPEKLVFSSKISPSPQILESTPPFAFGALWQPNKLCLLIPICAFANIFHHSLPGLSASIQDKKQLARLFMTALIVCFVGYASLAVTVSSFFGNDTNVASNLNWQRYQGIGNLNTARVVSFFVIIFPAIDVASAFPLNAITLANSVMNSFIVSPAYHRGRSQHDCKNHKQDQIMKKLVQIGRRSY